MRNRVRKQDILYRCGVVSLVVSSLTGIVLLFSVLFFPSIILPIKIIGLVIMYISMLIAIICGGLFIFQSVVATRRNKEIKGRS